MNNRLSYYSQMYVKVMNRRKNQFYLTWEILVVSRKCHPAWSTVFLKKKMVDFLVSSGVTSEAKDIPPFSYKSSAGRQPLNFLDRINYLSENVKLRGWDISIVWPSNISEGLLADKGEAKINPLCYRS